MLRILSRAWIALLLVVVSIELHADTVIVIQPEQNKTFIREIYREIVSGIQGVLDDAQIYTLGQDEMRDYRDDAINRDKKSDLLSALQSKKTIIALGQKSLDALAGLDIELPVLSGAVLNVENPINPQHYTLSYAVSPELLLAALSRWRPEITKVYVVHDQNISGWYVDKAAKYGEQLNITIEDYAIDSVQEAASVYRKTILPTLDPKREAIWFLYDSKATNKSVVDDILLLAYHKRIVTLSTNYSLVLRGSLLGYYPDNVALGRQLGMMAADIVKGNAPPQMPKSLTEAHLVLNQKAAERLGIKPDKKEYRYTGALVVTKNSCDQAGALFSNRFCAR